MCISIKESPQPRHREILVEELRGKEIVFLEEAITQYAEWGKLSTENLKKLRAIQKIIQYEEGKETSLDETLTHILKFYRRFVPYS